MSLRSPLSISVPRYHQDCAKISPAGPRTFMYATSVTRGGWQKSCRILERLLADVLAPRLDWLCIDKTIIDFFFFRSGKESGTKGMQ